ncbi:MAG TPA: nucleotidyltransferase domain-containing protein [Sedimentisphaerales bacterium]|nr:nucleotidyltransferase domain-containing protein [Sedimentisphaerales bacterium]
MRVVFADEKAVLLGLRRYAGQLRASRPEVEKVGYFGSYAAGTYGPASDVDLLIVLRRSHKRFIDRIPDYVPSDMPVSCDVFPYTSEEVRRMEQENSPWIRHVLKQVVWL